MANINKAQVNGTNRTKSTISFWVNKRVTADQKVFQFKNGSAEYLLKDLKVMMRFICIVINGSSYIGRIETNRVFRDTAAWYHFVIQVDTTDNTSSNRFRFYVNGDLQDNLKNETQPSQDATFELSTSSHHLYIGSQSDGGNAFAGNLHTFITQMDILMHQQYLVKQILHQVNGFPKTSSNVSLRNKWIFLKVC